MGLSLDTEAQTALRSLAPATKRRIRAALQMLEADPFHDKLDLKRLRSADASRFWRIRVANYRIVFSIHNGQTHVHRIFHRRDGYGWLERL